MYFKRKIYAWIGLDYFCSRIRFYFGSKISRMYKTMIKNVNLFKYLSVRTPNFALILRHNDTKIILMFTMLFFFYCHWLTANRKSPKKKQYNNIYFKNIVFIGRLAAAFTTTNNLFVYISSVKQFQTSIFQHIRLFIQSQDIMKSKTAIDSRNSHSQWGWI